MNDARSLRDEATPAEDPCRVTVADLDSIEAISKLLLTFNDPRAGADVLSRHIVKIRVLKARVAERFVVLHPARRTSQVAQQVALLGNRELEGILMSLLEDLVTLASEVGMRKVEDVSST
jgi:hypothetical protein